MTQMTAKAGIWKYGKTAEAAMIQELGQFENLQVYKPIDPAMLTKQQKTKALQAINLIKEKQDGCSELFGASDYIPNIIWNTIWVKCFLEAQGIIVFNNVFEQDNESDIKLEKNGQASAGQKSRHINVRYFWIKDRVQQEGIHIQHCPTLQMLADFFTKPLEGALFHCFQDVILGYKHVDSLSTPVLPVLDKHSSSKERVGKDNWIARCMNENEQEIDSDGFTTLGQEEQSMQWELVRR
jgi:hypothetical protein